jgi:uncharacterized protein involved in exopolysaccharide biosynthesis
MGMNTDTTGQQGQKMTARRGPLAVVGAHKRLALSAWLLIVAAGMAATLLWPATYESAMKIGVTRGAAAEGGTPEQVSDEEFAAQTELLLSRDVLAAVADGLKLTPEQAVNRLRESLDVRPASGSRTITVVCRDRDPERAARILNALFQQYEASARRLSEQAGAGRALGAQAAAFNRKLAEAQERLRQIEARGDVADIPLRRSLLLQQYYQTLSQLNAARTDLREAERRVSVLQTQLAAQPARIETASRTAYTQATEQMRQELTKLEAERARLLARENPDQRLVKDLERRVEKAKELIAGEERAVPQERAVAINDVHQRLTNDLLSAEANQTALAEREKALADLTAQIQSRLHELERQSAEQGAAERERAASEDAYQLYSRKAQEAELLGVTLPSPPAVSLADAPRVNPRAVSPRPLVNLAALVALGSAAACAAAYAAERRRPRPAPLPDATVRAELRVLAQIPEV